MKSALVHPELRGPYRGPAISPSGKQIALEYAEPGEPMQIRVWNRDSETLSYLTLGDRDSSHPFWSPDGNEIGFRSERNGVSALYTRPADLSSEARVLFPDPNSELGRAGWTPSEKLLVIRRSSDAEGSGRDQPLHVPDSEAVEFLDMEVSEGNATLSPDGNWLAYSSQESGLREVYVRPYPGPGSRTTVSAAEGGGQPVWARDGGELFYLAGQFPFVLTVATVRTDPDFGVESRDSLFPWTSYSTVGATSYYDLSPDGQQILAIGLFSGSNDEDRVVLVENWFEELKERVPVN